MTKKPITALADMPLQAPVLAVTEASVELTFDANATNKTEPDTYARDRAERLLGAWLFDNGAVTLEKGSDPVTAFAKYTYSFKVLK